MQRIAAAFAFLATPVLADGYITAAEVKPILTATKPQWIAVRANDGKDLVYFTNLLAWRCGVSTVSYGLNGAPPDTELAMEPCHEGTAQPNALMVDPDILPYITQPLGSVLSIQLRVTYDDGSTDVASYDRKSVLMP